MRAKTKKNKLTAMDEQRSRWAAIPVADRIAENETALKEILGGSSDLVIQRYVRESFAFMVVYMENMSERQQIEEFIVTPVLQKMEGEMPEGKWLEQAVSSSAGIQTVLHLGDAADELVRGSVLLFADHQSFGFSIPLNFMKGRSVEEPQSQTMVRGPRDGFVESLSVNIPLLRRRIASPMLHFKPLHAGKLTRTKLVVGYMEGLVDHKVLNHLLTKLSALETDKLFETGMLEELLKENGWSPFPMFLSTERPDVAASALSEGKVVILMEGTPFCLIAPATFWSFFQAAEDYYQNADIASLVRFIRLVAYLISLGFPALYIAVTTFHQELIPSELLISLAAQREGVPFPAFVEALVMEFIFEILREAGVRMPRPVGSAVSIVGAIVIGESAVAAGLVSPAIVIVVSLTAISSFVAPYYSFSGASRILRFVLMIVASTLGIFGMLIFAIGLVIHLASLSSAGTPYLGPFAPFELEEQKDGFLRLPLWFSNTRLYKALQRKQESGEAG